MDSTAAPEAKRFRNSQFPLHHTLDNLFGVGEGVGKGTFTFSNVILYMYIRQACMMSYAVSEAI